MKITITVERETGDRQVITQSAEWGSANLEWHDITTRGRELLEKVAQHFGDVGQRPGTWPGERGTGTGERGALVEVGDVQAELDRLQEQRNRSAGPR